MIKKRVGTKMRHTNNQAQISESQLRLFENIIRDLGPINKFLEDDDVNEIMVNSNKTMFIDTASKGLVYIEDVPSDKTLRIIKSLADYSNQVINPTMTLR